MADIWLPAGFSRDKDREVLACLLCDARFEMEQQDLFERHVAKCSEQNEDQIDEEISEVSLARQLPTMFGPEAGDVEFERWMKDHAEDVLLGKLKP